MHVRVYAGGANLEFSLGHVSKRAEHADAARGRHNSLAIRLLEPLSAVLALLGVYQRGLE